MSTEDFSYIITGKGPRNAAFRITTERGVTTVQTGNITFGKWDITVEALYHRASGVVSFGSGSAVVDVIQGDLSTCQVSITPFEGDGDFVIVAKWDNSSIINAVLQGELSRIGYASIPVNFNVMNGEGQAQMSLASGIYSLSLILKDGEGVELTGVADSIRIVNSLTTAVTYDLIVQQCVITEAQWEIVR
jgi:hypothetical protein